MDGGKKVWVPDNEQGFRLGEIVDIGSDSITVQVDEPNAKVHECQHMFAYFAFDSSLKIFLDLHY